MKWNAIAILGVVLAMTAPGSVCQAYWDPGTPIQGYAYAALSGDPGQQLEITVYEGDNVEFWAEAVDIDVQADPPGEDGVHCDWYRYTDENNQTLFGWTRANNLCQCEGYQQDKTTYSWSEADTYTVRCELNDCAHLANDPSADVEITVHVLDAESCHVIYTYDKNGNRVQMRDWRGKTKYEYDAFNRLKKVTEPDDKWIGYEYNLNNNRISMTDHFGGHTYYDYTDRGLLWHLTDRAGGITTYEYWDNGLLKKMTYPNGAYAEYTYHAQRDWLVSLNHYKPGGTVLIAGFTYEYDATYWGKNGTRTAMTENILLPQEQSRIESTVEYTYDNVYRLTGEERTGSLSYTKSYTYDDIGNRLTKVEGGVTTYYHYDYQYPDESGQKVRDYGSSNTYPYTGNTILDYDNSGNTTDVTPPSGPATSYTYDYRNLMTSVKVGGNTTAQFAYDGAGLRRSAVFSSGTTQFLFDGRELIAELDGQGSLAAFYTLGSGGRLSRQAGPAVGYYHADGLASVKAISSQTPVVVTDAYTYDAWGNELTPAGATQQPYHYVGGLGYYTHYQDSSFGMQQLGVRYYDPQGGRFTQTDRVGDSANRYIYVGDSPVGYVDEGGLYRHKPGGPYHPSGKVACKETDDIATICLKLREIELAIASHQLWVDEGYTGHGQELQDWQNARANCLRILEKKQAQEAQKKCCDWNKVKEWSGWAMIGAACVWLAKQACDAWRSLPHGQPVPTPWGPVPMP